MGTKLPPLRSSWTKKLEKVNAVGIDSMCFIYQFEAHPLFGPLIFYLFSQLEERKLKGFTSVLSLAEILSFQKLVENKVAWEEEKQKFYQIPNLEAVEVDGKICEAAALLRGKYNLHLPDSIQIVTAIFNRADAFITNDERIKKVKELPIILLKDYLK